MRNLSAPLAALAIALCTLLLHGCGSGEDSSSATAAMPQAASAFRAMDVAQGGSAVEQEVSQLYVALFGRAPDTEGLNYWAGRRNAGETMSRVADAMYAVTPARQYYPSGLAPREVVASFYRNVLGREADAGGLDYWTAKLTAKGATEGSLIAEMIGVVASYTGNVPEGIKSAQFFSNRVTAAILYAQKVGIIGPQSTQAISNVTHDSNTLNAAANRINSSIPCRPIVDAAFLDITPIDKFGGLRSNWSNADSLPRSLDGQRFAWAIGNYAAIANEQDDSTLKAKIVSSLFRWADAKAYEASRWCWSPTSLWDSTCTQWTDPNGNDLSAIQDNNYVMEQVEAIRRGYSLISPWARTNEPNKHSKIVEWLDFWDINTPNPNGVFFGLGMGRYHWEIQRIIDRNGVEAALPLIKEMMAGISPLIFDDGSIEQRTSRGNRALWYHYTALNEIMSSIWIAKQVNITLDPALESKIHKAVNIFVSTLEDPTYITPWAKVGYNNGGDGTAQVFNFTNWFDEQYAGSWAHLYVNWYPQNPITARLLKKFPYPNTKSASLDSQFGIPIACVSF